MPDGEAAAPAGSGGAALAAAGPGGRAGLVFGRLTLEVRQSLSPAKRGLFVAIGLGTGLAIALVVLAASGVTPRNVYDEFVLYTFARPRGLGAVLVECAPLILVGLAAAVAFKVQFWNIGLEGQFLFGAIGATAVAQYDVGPAGARIYLMFAAAAAGGVFWTLAPVALKLRLQVNEIISTLLLNYVALLFVLNQIYGAWQDPDRFPHSAQYDPIERLPKLGFEDVHFGIVIALVAGAAVWWLVSRSRFGRYMAFVGSNPVMARAVGLPVATVVVVAVAISGALAGLSGYVVAAAVEFRLTGTMSIGYLFSGIVIAFLARNNPVAVLVVGFLLGGLFVGGKSLQVFFSLPVGIIWLLEAIIVLAVAGSDFLVRYRLHLRRVGR
jgi:simple sugar transport system permease protein